MKISHFYKSLALVGALVYLILTLLSCVSAGPIFQEKSIDSRIFFMEIKNGEHAEIQYEYLKRTYGYSGGWFPGINSSLGGGSTYDYYMVITATLKVHSGETRTYTWIGSYNRYSRYYIKPGRLALSGNDAFIEYTVVPTVSRRLDRNARLLVKYVRYAGTRKHKYARSEPEYPMTYKWPNRYLWEEVSKEVFDKAAENGDMVSVDFGHDFDDGSHFDYYGYYKNLDELNLEHIEFLNAARSAGSVEWMLNRDPELIHAYDDNGKTALHLGLESHTPRALLPTLFNFNPDINAIDYHGHTPLHRAVLLGRIDQTIIDQLIGRGGVILYPECSLPELIAHKKLSIKSTAMRGYSDITGWVSDDVYQVKEECTDDCTELTIRTRAWERIRSELGLRGAPASKIQRRIEQILANMDTSCYKRVVPKRARLVRICAPGLRGLVKEYNEVNGRSRP